MTNLKKSYINNLTISTVKIGRSYETMVLDQFGNELKTMTATIKKEAEHNHLFCVAHFANRRNCIHVI